MVCNLGIHIADVYRPGSIAKANAHPPRFDFAWRETGDSAMLVLLPLGWRDAIRSLDWSVDWNASLPGYAAIPLLTKARGLLARYL